MRISAVLLAGCLMATPAMAFDRSVDHWIGDCGASSLCGDFRDEWPKAFRGDPDAQKNMTFYFSTGARGAVKRDLSVACAWEIVLLAARHPDTPSSEGTNLNHYCGRAAVGDLAGPARIAAELFSVIYGKPLPPPPWEWAPPVAEIPIFDSTPNMIQTAARLSALCPGASIDQARVNEVLARVGIDPRQRAPGGAYDAAAIRGRVFREIGTRSIDVGGANCRGLRDFYGPLGSSVAGIAVVPVAADYPN